MSLSASLNNAFTGLSVSSRLTEVISSNVANAMTPGYARRSVQISAQSFGGVRLSDIQRDVDTAVLGDRRIATASAGGLNRRADFLAAFETAIGSADSNASLTGRVSALEVALIEAKSKPDSDAMLGKVVSAARGLAGQISSAAATVQEARRSADGRIADQVQVLNDGLEAVAKANAQIRRMVATGEDASALMDQRQELVDGLAEIVPLREVARPDGQIALFSSGGAVLIDGPPARFGFVETGAITADMTQTSGALSGLTLNGTAIRTSGEDGLMSGGTLAADFAIRDELAPAAQTRLDAFARDLVERMADPAVDPTLTTGAAGLFTDAGGAFDITNEVGLAQRLAVNAAVDPAAGGALWRIRSGIGATAPGPTGSTALLSAMEAALAAPRPTASGGFVASARSLTELGADIQSAAASDTLTAEGTASFATARQDSLRQTELALGVDSDQEMQNLLVVEQAYGANARVVQTIDDLLQLLLGIGR